ncbi:MAG TPA: YncE family protein [Bacteroidota bacterium]
MKYIIALLLALALLVAGCEKKSNNPLTPAATGASLVLVANSTGNSVSTIDLGADKVTANALTVGSAPNQVLVAAGMVFVVSSLSNNVMVFDTASLTALGTINVGDGTNPMNIAVLGAKGYVACWKSNEVRVVNLATRTVTKSIPAGVGTTGIVAANGKLFATNSGYDGNGYLPGVVTVISAASDAVVDTVSVGMNPVAAAVGPDGNVHVVCTGNYADVPGVVSVIDASTDKVLRTIPIGGAPGAIAFAPDGTAFVGYFSDGMATYNGRSYAIIDSVTHPLLRKGGTGIAVDAQGYIYVADFSYDQVYKLDPSRNLVKTYTVGDGPISVALKP